MPVGDKREQPSQNTEVFLWGCSGDKAAVANLRTRVQILSTVLIVTDRHPNPRAGGGGVAGGRQNPRF